MCLSCVCCAIGCRFFLCLSLALRSHDQFPGLSLVCADRSTNAKISKFLKTFLLICHSCTFLHIFVEPERHTAKKPQQPEKNAVKKKNAARKTLSHKVTFLERHRNKDIKISSKKDTKQKRRPTRKTPSQKNMESEIHTDKTTSSHKDKEPRRHPERKTSSQPKQSQKYTQTEQQAASNSCK